MSAIIKDALSALALILIAYIEIELVLFTIWKTGGIGISKRCHKNNPYQATKNTNNEKSYSIRSSLVDSYITHATTQCSDSQKQAYCTTDKEYNPDYSEYLFRLLIKPMKPLLIHTRIISNKGAVKNRANSDFNEAQKEGVK